MDNHYIALNPIVLGGPLSDFANNYSRYAFREVLIEVTPTCGTNAAVLNNQPIAYSIAIANDGSEVGKPNSFADCASTVPSIISTPFTSKVAVHTGYHGNRTWLTDDSFGVAIPDSIEKLIPDLTNQGMIAGYADGNYTGASPVYWGYITVTYICDLYQPARDAGDIPTLLRKFNVFSDEKKQEFLRKAQGTPIKAKVKAGVKPLLSPGIRSKSPVVRTESRTALRGFVSSHPNLYDEIKEDDLE